MIIKHRNFDVALESFEQKIAAMDDDEFFESLGTSIEELKVQHTRAKISKRAVPRKSKHKHDYEDVLISRKWISPFTQKSINSIGKGKQCNICGKIRETEWPIEGIVNGKNCILGAEATLLKYPDLKVIEME